MVGPITTGVVGLGIDPNGVPDVTRASIPDAVQQVPIPASGQWANAMVCSRTFTFNNGWQIQN
jgi:hypothetical protein